jgi:hypothetical protein
MTRVAKLVLVAAIVAGPSSIACAREYIRAQPQPYAGLAADAGFNARAQAPPLARRGCSVYHGRVDSTGAPTGPYC